MIKLDPRPAEVPDCLRTSLVDEARKECIRKHNKQEKFNFKEKNYWTNAKKSLWEYQNGKCCFCERKRDSNAEADVEHFRPKAGIETESSHLGYQWLAYEWKNLFYSCKKCNGRPNKGTHFPIMGTRANGPGDDLSEEKPLFIKPDEDDPEDYLKYEWVIYRDKLVKLEGIDGKGRGNTTIRHLGLNDNHLSAERAKYFVDLRISAGYLNRLRGSNAVDADALYQDMLNNLKSRVDKTSEFAGFARYFLKSFLGFGEYARLFCNA